MIRFFGREVGTTLTSRFAFSRTLFVRGLGGVFVLAFASLWVQVHGLIGPEGIAPAQELLDGAARALGTARLWTLPNVLWPVGAGAGALHALCGAGVALGVALAAGVAPRAVLVALWALYLSLCSLGGPFLGFQWDGLLLESALVALFLAPRGLCPRDGWRVEPLRGALLLARLLLFKLMLLSGLVKLLSGDPAWRSLRALDYHFWTQPLPTPLGLWAARLPEGLLRAATVAMFAVELALPLLLFTPRRLRHLAAAGFVLLQVVIAATGNYGFFNLLSALLCLPAVEWRWPGGVAPVPAPPSSPPRRWGFVVAAAAVVLIGAGEALGRLGGEAALPGPALTVLEAAAPFRTVNTYGLFAVMTTERPELELEGSEDGVGWRPYRFRWKPDAPDSPARWVAPHMPRLDWQLWFAALGNCGGDAWFLRFEQRLLQGRAPVLALLAEDPFPGHPPRYLRTTRWQYRPGPPGGAVWQRDGDEPYCPTLTLDAAGRLIPADL